MRGFNSSSKRISVVLVKIYTGTSLGIKIEDSGLLIPWIRQAPKTLDFIMHIQIFLVLQQKESPFIGKKGWAVNSVVLTFECSNHFSPKLTLSFYSSTVELNTVNIVIDVRFILEA